MSRSVRVCCVEELRARVLYDPTSDLYRLCSLIIVIGQAAGSVLGVLMARKLLQQGVSRFQTW